MPPRCGCSFFKRTIGNRSTSRTKPLRRRRRACAGSESFTSDSSGTGDGEVAALAEKLEADVATALNDDLNAPRAVAALFDFVRAANRELDKPVAPAGTARALAAFERVAGVLDVLPTTRAPDAALVRWAEERIAARAQARKSKDFKAADVIRAELKAKGIEIEDTPTGTKWRVV